MVMRENAVPSPAAPHSARNWKFCLLFVLFACLCGCADQAFLPPPENLPYAQEHERDSESEGSRMPPLLDTE